MYGELTNGAFTTKLTINLSDITSEISLTDPAYDIFSAAISRTAIINNVYNICITGRTTHFDERAYYVVRVNLDDYSLYEDETYPTYLGLNVDDSWGGHPDFGYRVNSLATSNEFLTFAVQPRTRGYVPGYQYLMKLTVAASSMTSIYVTNLSNPSNVLRWSIISEDGGSVLINLSNNTSEGLYNTSNLNRSFIPSGISCFVRNGTTNYLVVSDKTLRSMSNTQLADYGDIIEDGFYYLFGHQNKLYVIYPTYIVVYEINFNANYTLTLVGRISANTSRDYTITSYTRFVQVPFYDAYIYTGHLGQRINKIYTKTVDRLPNMFYTDTYELYRPYLDYNTYPSEILNGKKVITLDGRITGTMPNNGELSYNSSENNQTIPAGYTSGGTITGISIEDMSAYDLLLEQSKYLLYGGTLYTELEYIIFTGTQYIDTEIIPTNHSTEAKVNFDTYNNDEHLLGTSRGYLYYHFTPYNNRYYWGNDNGESNGGSWTAGAHVIVYNGDNHAITIDGTIIGSETNIASSQNLWIGRRDTEINLQATLYYIKIIDKSTNELVRDLIPVKRIFDNVICFYDKISKEFFENQGTGDFIAGPEKGEPSYIELEYIQSTGTQYIDTGIKPDGNTRVVAKWTNGTNNGVIFGAYNGDWTAGYGLYQNAASSSGTYWRHYFSNDNTNKVRVTPAVLDMNKGTFIFNNETIYTTATKSNTTSYSMYIFAGNWNGSRVEQKTSLSLWYFQIYDNDTLVRDFVPAKRIADNTICLYDKVSNAFFTNQGTGVFTAGPEK